MFTRAMSVVFSIIDWLGPGFMFLMCFAMVLLFAINDFLSGAVENFIIELYLSGLLLALGVCYIYDDCSKEKVEKPLVGR